MNYDHLASFARDLVPELAGVPLYLLDHPPHLPLPESAVAYFTRGHFGIRDHLMALDQWQGNGITIVFVGEVVDATDLLGIFLHELAHALPWRPLRDTGPTEAERTCQSSTLEKLATTTEPIIPWKGHGARWIRRTLHLHYRALWLGRVIPLIDLCCAGPGYRLSPVWRYLSALGSEPFTLRGWSFAEIQAEPAPQAFTELFAADVAEYERRQKTKLEYVA